MKTTPNFSAFRASWRTDCKRTVPGSLKLTLQICTRWTITSGMPCWKTKINSSRNVRRLMSWNSPRRPSGKICHKNTTRRWWTSPSAWLPAWLWLPTVVTLSICCNSVHLEVCILITSSTNRLTFYWTTLYVVLTLSSYDSLEPNGYHCGGWCEPLGRVARGRRVIWLPKLSGAGAVCVNSV